MSSEGKLLIFFDAAKKWKTTEIVMYSSPPRLVTMSQALVRSAHGAFREWHRVVLNTTCSHLSVGRRRRPSGPCLVPTQPHRRHPAQVTGRAQKLFAFLLCTTSTSSTIKEMVWKTDSSIPFLWTYAIDQDDKGCASQCRWKNTYKMQADCVTRAPLLYFIRSWVALSFKVCESMSE